MDLVLVLVTAAVFPVVCLGFVLWMGRIEDTIPGSVARSVRRPDPAPVLRVPVRRRSPAPAVVPAPGPATAAATPADGLLIPAQRTEAVPPVVPTAPAAPAAPAGT
jgi:hypothetical protein